MASYSLIGALITSIVAVLIGGYYYHVSYNTTSLSSFGGNDNVESVILQGLSKITDLSVYGIDSKRKNEMFGRVNACIGYNANLDLQVDLLQLISILQLELPLT